MAIIEMEISCYFVLTWISVDIFTALMSWLGTADYGALDTLLHKETADLDVSSMMLLMTQHWIYCYQI